VSTRRLLRLLAYTDSHEVGGAELALGYLLGALAPEIEVGVLAVDAAVGKAIANHRPRAAVRVVDLAPGAGSRVAVFAHMRAIRAFSPDVLHANQAWPWACGDAEVAGVLTPGVGVIAVDHLPVSVDLPRRQRIGRRLLARRFDAHIAVGERVARLVEEVVGLPHDSVGPIANGVPPIDPGSLPLPLPVPVSGPVIGSLGRLTAQKGYDVLVRVLADLPEATLVLVGDGPERTALETLARRLGVADRLVVTGWVEQARSHLATFDLFALPSRWEGMPLVILEAMFAGLPVVASDVGSVAEAVLDGETGFVVTVDDERTLRDRLAMLLADSAMRQSMGERARARAQEQFTADVMARRYEQVYYDVLQGKRDREGDDLHVTRER
jgi:glycosyltransferase involved in cell wall biosynthesis